MLLGMTDSPIKIKITGKLTYDDDITIIQAAKIIEFLHSGASDAGPGGTGSLGLDGRQKYGAASGEVQNPRGALEVSGAKTNPEKIVALAAFVLRNGADTFKPDDVKAAFRSAREPLPGNFTRDLGRTITAGLVAEDRDVAGAYYLTNKAEGVLEGGYAFPKSSSSAGSRGRSTKKSSPKVAKPETLAEIDEFYSTMDGFPPYGQLKNEKDRLLWVVTYVRDKHGRKGATNKEIVWISDYIGAGIPTNNIGGAFNQAKKPGYAIRSSLDNTIRVTDTGVAHLKTLASAD